MHRPRICATAFPTIRIDRYSSTRADESPCAEMEVRRCGAANITREPDRLATRDDLADANIDDRQMHISGTELSSSALWVTNFDSGVADQLPAERRAAVRSFKTGKRDLAVSDG